MIAKYRGGGRICGEPRFGGPWILDGPRSQETFDRSGSTDRAMDLGSDRPAVCLRTVPAGPGPVD